MHVHLACTQVATLMETTSAAEEAEVRPTPTPTLTLTLARALALARFLASSEPSPVA